MSWAVGDHFVLLLGYNSGDAPESPCWVPPLPPGTVCKVVGVGSGHLQVEVETRQIFTPFELVLRKSGTPSLPDPPQTYRFWITETAEGFSKMEGSYPDAGTGIKQG
mgnify:CR=1 FL=1